MSILLGVVQGAIQVVDFWESHEARRGCSILVNMEHFSGNFGENWVKHRGDIGSCLGELSGKELCIGEFVKPRL